MLPSPKMSTFESLETLHMLYYTGKRIKVASQMILKKEMTLDYLLGPNVITRVS